MNMKKAKILSLAGILSLATAIPSAYALENGQTFKDWTATCAPIKDKNVCHIQQQVFDKQNKLVLVFSIGKVENVPTPVAEIGVPSGVFLPFGIALSIDGEKIGRIPYEVCLKASCRAPFTIQPELSKKLKKGSKLQVTFMDRNGEASYPVSLSGITKALDAL